MTSSYPTRVISADEFEEFAAVPGQAFLEEWTPEAIEVERPVTEFDRTIAAFDGTQMVGTASAYTFRLTVPGGSADAAGISLVSVLPSHRRRGILTEMMQYEINDARQRGEALAILYASESGIYGRYGFGLATWHQRMRIGRGDGRLAIGAASPHRSTYACATTRPPRSEPSWSSSSTPQLPGRPGMLARTTAGGT